MTFAFVASVVVAQCSVTAEWRPGREVPLALADGAVFAVVPAAECAERRGPKATATMTGDGGVAVRLKSRGVELVASTAALGVTLPGPLAWDGVFSAAPATELVVTAVDAGAAAVVPAPRADLEPGVFLDVGARDGGVVAVELREAPVALAPGWQWALRVEEFDRCDSAR